MRHETPRSTAVVLLALAALIGAAVMLQVDQAGLMADSTAAGQGLMPTDEASAGSPSAAPPEPAAACKMRPECSSNSDCDERCGAGQGKCVHSNCPIRICRCS